MDPLKSVKNFRNKKVGIPKNILGRNKNNKRVEVKVRINLWKILIAFLIFIFFLPFLISVFEVAGGNGKVDTSQAISDIKDGKVKELMVQGPKLIITYNDGSTKVATKEDNESFTDILNVAKIDPTSVKYTVVDQSATKVIGEILGVLLPILLMAGFFLLILR